jgi:molecular chaperone GrpE
MTGSYSTDAGRADSGPQPGRTGTDKDALRRRLLRRFNLWLDEMLDHEPPPPGIAADLLADLQASTEDGSVLDRCDLFSQWSAIAAVTEETKLQGRSFKQLSNTLGPVGELAGSVSSLLERSEQHLEYLKQVAREELVTEMLDALLDIRDRLDGGAASAQRIAAEPLPTPRSRLMTRFRSKAEVPRNELASAVIQGYALSRDRLDALLAGYGVRPIECLGQAFDPTGMKAVDIDMGSTAPDGTVMEVYRTGYWRHNQVYRPAEVKVARKE